MQEQNNHEKNNAIIEYDYEAMLAAAGELKELSKLPITNEVLDRVSDMIDKLNWSGQAAAAYKQTTKRAVDSLKNAITTTSEDDSAPNSSKLIETLANLLKHNVETMKNADKEIAEKLRGMFGI